MQKTTRYVLICITAGFLLLTLVKSFYLSNRYGGTDLRCRVVGTRLLTTSHSPYFYKWNPADGEFYLDPNDEPQKLTNGNVVTPATSVIIYPLSLLPYAKVRLLWTILQVLAAAGIIWLLFKNKNISTTFLIASPIILGIICSEIWLYNIERGQMYIFYAFLFALMYRLYNSKMKYNQFASGFVGGLFILFRPFTAIIGLGFLLQGKKQWILGSLAGFVIGVLLFVLPNRDAWVDYFKAMPEYIKMDMDQGTYNDNAIVPAKPAVIEGTTNITEYRYFSVDRLDTVYHFMKRAGINITSNQSLILFAITIAFLSFFFYKLRKKFTDSDPLFLFGFLLVILSELFIPAPRGAYNVILWIFPLSLIYLRARSNLPILIILVTALLLLHNFPFIFPHQGELPEFIFVVLTMFTIFFPKLFKNLSDGHRGT